MRGPKEARRILNAYRSREASQDRAKGRRDLAGPAEGDAKAVLDAAIEAGVMDLVVVGKTRDGEQWISTSMGDMDRAAGIMLRAANWLTTIEVVNDVVIDTEGA